MTQNENLISNMSYCSKDFQTIYPELLDLVKRLAVKWDPTVSDESDPGVLLIKLAAILGDKCNYNIDKNTLENFPLSVTQQSNAIQMFNQLGYHMRWYEAGKTNVSMRWIGEVEDINNAANFTIPIFTMLSDSEDSVIFTSTQSCQLIADGATTTTVPVIQGAAVQYDINGETVITASNLDSYNRLYFTDRNVAENGIFIHNVSSNQDDYNSWNRVDNLVVQPLNQKNFMFGISADNQSCYIEFPEDVDSLFGQGVTITYIKTDGVNGNVARNIIEKFYEDLNVTDLNDPTKTEQLTTENVQIRNGSAIIDGLDPETIDEAYRGYQKTVGTFETLVTLRDYMNAIIQSELVSNCFVCDRTGDIQSSYYIVSEEAGQEVSKLVISQTANEDDLFAFDLRMYLLNYVENVNTKELFDKTFEMIPYSNAQTRMVQNYLSTKQIVQHDFQPLLGSKVCMFKNKYPLVCRIIPQYQLNATQTSEVQKNIFSALYKYFNAKSIDFGNEINYDDVYDIISKADSRIKAVAMNDITYTTYAVYFDEAAGTFQEVVISDPTTTNTTAKNIRTDVYAKSVLAGKTQLLIPNNKFDYSLSQSFLNTKDDIKNITTNVDIQLFGNSTGGQSSSYVLKEHENIQFFAPNLIDAVTYSSYVKFEYKVNFNVPANADYKLGPDECIIFYWKNSDDENEPYTYKVYMGGQSTGNSGNIIKPSFILKANSEQTLNGESLLVGLSAGEIRTGECSTELTDIISGIYEDSEVLGILSATKSVKMRVKNSSILSSPINYCYWILNKAEERNSRLVYKLFSKDQTEYILQYGESFIYTNSDASEMVILGSGTKLYRSAQNGASLDEWVVDKIEDLTSVATKGTSAFKDEDWFTFTGNRCHLVTTEMQFVNLGEGVKLTATRSDLTKTLTFKNNGLGTGESLDNFTFQYSYEGDTSVQELPAIINHYTDWGVESDYGWQANSVLNLSMGPEDAQILVDNQSITYSDGLSTGVISGGTSAAPIFILAANKLALQGGINVDTSVMNIAGDISYLSLYWYQGGSVSGVTLYPESDSFAMRIDSTSKTGTITFKLPEGKYLVPVMNNSKATTSLTLSLGSTTLSEIGSSTTNLIQNKKYFVVMNVDNAAAQSDQTLTLSFSRASSEIDTLDIVIEKIFPYTEANISNPSFNDVITRMKELDVNNIFNYVHVTDSDTEIVDPLDSYSFMDTNHIFNKFTICQLDTSTLLNNIKVTNKVK